MTIESLLSPVTLPLKPTDTVEQALEFMIEFRVRHLPIVTEENDLLGNISEEELLAMWEADRNVADILATAPLFVYQNMHPYDVAKLLLDHDLSTLPVLDNEQKFVGIIERRELFNLFTEMLAVQHEGAVLVMEVNHRDFSLAKLTHLLEQNDVKVLSITSEPHIQTGNYAITIKVNVEDTSRVRHVLEHHSYRVIETYEKNNREEDLQERIDEFMRYLEV